MLRALAATLGRQGASHQLIEWGRRLHDRFVLPFYLRQDLHTLFSTLEDCQSGSGHAHYRLSVCR